MEKTKLQICQAVILTWLAVKGPVYIPGGMPDCKINKKR